MAAATEDPEEEANPFAAFLEGDIDMDELQSRLSPNDFEPPSQPLPESLDRRLVGTWRYTKLISGGGTSFLSERYLVLARDGTFVTSWRGMTSSTFLDSSGNWAGVSSMDSGVSPNERGRWSVENGEFRLEYDDNTISVCGFEVSGNKFVCYMSGETQSWEPA